MSYEEICYNKNFLKSVILKIDWESLTPFLDNNTIDKIIEILPLYEKQLERQIEVNIKACSTINNLATKHVFFNKDKTFKFSVSEIMKTIWFETARYNSWEQFIQKIQNLFHIIADKIISDSTTRIGLRFINQIPLKTYKDIKNNFKKPIYNLFIENSSDKEMSRLFVIKESTYQDYFIRFQYGIPNQHYPNPIIIPEFILDVDVYANRNHDLEGIIANLTNFHYTIQDIFESSITDNFRKFMGIVQDGK